MGPAVSGAPGTEGRAEWLGSLLLSVAVFALVFPVADQVLGRYGRRLAQKFRRGR
jgi:hypothetical protein